MLETFRSVRFKQKDYCVLARIIPIRSGANRKPEA
jgi:hypothetical protein